MKVALFGATGRTGKHFISLALESGHTIKALVRDPSKLQCTDDQLSHITVIRGDVTDSLKVSETVAGVDSVVNVLGHAKESPKDIMVLSTRQILQAGKEHRVGLVLMLTTAGVKYPEDAGSIGQSFMKFYLETFETAQMTDHQAMCDLVRETKDIGFEWVVVRAARLTNGALTKEYQVRKEKGPGLIPCVSRADVAHCIVSLLTNGQHRGQMPFVFR
jgi:putative NADH-flavin reductase